MCRLGFSYEIHKRRHGIAGARARLTRMNGKAILIETLLSFGDSTITKAGARNVSAERVLVGALHALLHAWRGAGTLRGERD